MTTQSSSESVAATAPYGRTVNERRHAAGRPSSANPTRRWIAVATRHARNPARRTKALTRSATVPASASRMTGTAMQLAPKTKPTAVGRLMTLAPAIMMRRMTKPTTRISPGSTTPSASSAHPFDGRHRWLTRKYQTNVALPSSTVATSSNIRSRSPALRIAVGNTTSATMVNTAATG